MTQSITNSTTYDLASYYADLKHLPRLSDQEQHSLVVSLSTAAPACPAMHRDDTQARHRLIEGHLGLATHLAITLCPPSRYCTLPDLIGEANLALVEATTRYDFRHTVDFTAYLAVCLRGTIKGAIGDDHLIRIPSSTRAHARQKGTREPWDAREPVSLDRLLDDSEESLADVLEAPPPQSAPPPDQEKRAQVEALLAYLSPRAQTILRLRYGLSDDNEHAHTTAEITRALGISRDLVLTTQRDALRRLRALVTGQATITHRGAKLCISSPGACTLPMLTAEQEDTLKQASTRLRAQGVAVTGRLLAKETGIAINRVQAFLRAHRDETPQAARARQHQQRLEHLADVCAELEAQGEPVTVKRLARAAQVRRDTVAAFLRTRKEERHAVQARQ